MKKTTTGYKKIRHIYENNMNVDLLAEPLSTCSIDDDCLQVKLEMETKDFDIYGVENANGSITGYVKREVLSRGKIEDFYIPFSSDNLISDSTSLIELLDLFQHRDYMFILETNEVSKIVTIADLHKHPIRMLAFSLISLLEMYLTYVIRDSYPEGEWKDKLSSARLQSAEHILNLRLEKNEALTLLDSTQLSDKGEIVRNTPALLQQLGFASKSKCADFFREIEFLRNNTAHSQEVIYHDDRELIRIMLQLSKVLDNVTSE
ncbi:hypothetical protein [Virgibacillus kimchii]